AFDEIDAALERARYRLRKNAHKIEQLEQLGHERALIYKTMVLTGLRRRELASLTIGQLYLDGERPYAELNAADAKNREAAQIAIRSDLATELGEWIENLRSRNRRDSNANHGQSCQRMTANDESPNSTPVLNVPEKLVKVLERDLKLAGIPKRDDRGR